MANVINWFEIPATDFERAVKFYSDVMNVEIAKGEFMGEPQAFFPTGQGEAGGAIVRSDRLSPSTTGTLIYLNLGSVDSLNQAIGRVEANGGKVEMPVTDIGDPGFISIITDTEGNRIGLHSFK
jgi:predicted enzyme related to lactoylglutathione lyase